MTTTSEALKRSETRISGEDAAVGRESARRQKESGVEGWNQAKERTMRKPRYTIEHTLRGFVVFDNLKSMRVVGPFDGKTGKAVARERRDKLELIAANERNRRSAR